MKNININEKGSKMKTTPTKTIRKLDDLKFMVPRFDASKQELSFYNVFQSIAVRNSILRYKMSKTYQDVLDCNYGGKDSLKAWTHFIFFSLRSRAEHELIIDDLFGKPAGDHSSGIKTDIYTLCIEPNAALLREMVDSVTKASCKEAYREFRKRLAEQRKLYDKAYVNARKQS